MNKDEFLAELEKIKINISEFQYEQLEKYYNLLIEKNKVMNLTGITKKQEVFLKHFYDSLTLHKIVNLNAINSLCDLGSGAGFPGIVIKIVFPKLQITLVDSLNKRINFLNFIIDELKLENIKTINQRIEEFSIENKEKFDLVTARAVAPTNVLLEIGIQAVKVNKLFALMKGKDEKINISLCDKLNVKLMNKTNFNLPIENSERTLILFKKLKPTNNIFPRKFNEIKKRPL